MSSKDFREGIEFWEEVGQSFIDYSRAPTTEYYLQEELKIIKDNFNLNANAKLLKLDLWNEALNTELLFHIPENSWDMFGIDISPCIVKLAGIKASQFNRHLNCIIGNISSMPFKNNTFDFIYTMGTIEHSSETKNIVEEIIRILKPGGKAIIGVPNKLDPLFRNILFHIMEISGLYPFGIEKTYSIAELFELVHSPKIQIINSGSIIFLPALIRVADLFLFKYLKPLSQITGVLYKPFQFLKNNFKFLGMAGYMIYVVIEKK